MFILNARKRLLAEKSFLTTVALSPRKSVINSAEDNQLKSLLLVLKLIFAGRILLSPSLYDSVRNRRAFRALESDFQQGLFSTLTKKNRKEYILKYLSIISLLVEAVLE